MKIVLNILAVTTGGQVTRSRAFLERFPVFAPGSKLVVFKNVDVLPEIISSDYIEIIDVNIGRGPFRSLRRMVWENTKMLGLVSEIEGDIYLSFSHYLPFRMLSLPAVVAVSNLAPFSPEAFKLEGFFGKLRLFLLKKTIISSSHKAAQVIALSFMCKKVLISNKILADSVAVIPNGVEISDKVYCDDQDTPKPFILSVSHFYRYKNVEQLLNSYARLSEQLRKNYRLKIVGGFYDLKYVQELRLLAHRLEITDNVDFIPGLKKDELDEVYSQAKLFVFTSIIENSPNILLEAMSHGLPVISIDNDPMPEFGSTAVQYVKAHDEIALANKIEYLLNDKKKCEEMRTLSKKRAQLFSWDKFTQEVIRICNLSHKESLGKKHGTKH